MTHQLPASLAGGGPDSFRPRMDGFFDSRDSSSLPKPPNPPNPPPVPKPSRGSATQRLLHVLIRTLLPLIALGLCAVFARLSAILFFIGGVFGSGISVVIPSLCYLRLFRRELPRAEKALVLLHALLGGVCAGLTVLVALCPK